MEAADILAKTTQALQPIDKITHLTIDDKERGITFEVWVDAQGSRARADRTENGHRLSEIIVNGRTYDEIPSLSSANTPDVTGSLALPWFVAPDERFAPVVESSGVNKKQVDGRQVVTVQQITSLGDNELPFSVPALFADADPCPLRRSLTVDQSSYLPISFDVTVLCQTQGLPRDYGYTAAYSRIEFLDRDSLPESLFSPEAARAQIIAEELAALKASTFDVYWLGPDFPTNLEITADDGLIDARADWRSQDGEVAYFKYGRIHSSPAGLEIYEWPKGDEGRFCLAEWPVSSAVEVMTKFGPALYCDAQEHQLMFTVGATQIRLVEGFLDSPKQDLIDRANALISLK
jgi:hypothetical protein